MFSGGFYEGEKLSRRFEGRAAIQWIQLLAQLQRTELIEAALDQYSTAARVPSFVLEMALEYGIEKKFGSVIDKAVGLGPRMIALQAEDGHAVAELILRARVPCAGPPFTSSRRPDSFGEVGARG